MNALGKVMLVAGMGRKMYGKWRFQRFLSLLTTVLMLSVAAVAIICAMVIGGFYAAYHFFIVQGMQPWAGILLTGLIALLCVVVLMDAIRRRIRNMKSTLETPTGSAVDAFFDGLFSR